MKVKIKNPILRILIVVIMSFVVYQLAAILAAIATKIFKLDEEYFVEYFQGSIFILAILLSLIFTKGKISEYGFKLPQKTPYLRLTLLVFLVSVVELIAMFMAPIEGEGHFANDYGFTREILSIWLLASTAEELFMRGFVQGYLQPLSHLGIKLKKLFLSLPVITSAALFMAMHIPLVLMGMDKVMFAILAPILFIVGAIAGYYREKTGSLIPAIIVHMLANIFPSLLAIIAELL